MESFKIANIVPTLNLTKHKLTDCSLQHAFNEIKLVDATSEQARNQCATVSLANRLR